MRRGITPAMALLAALGAGVFAGGAATVAQAERTAQEARQGTTAGQDRTRGPLGLGSIEQAIRRLSSGTSRARPPTYRKRPRGTHKQNARVEARRLRRAR